MQYERRIGRLVSVVALWLSGYGGYSQTPMQGSFPAVAGFSLFFFLPEQLSSNETSISFLK